MLYVCKTHLKKINIIKGAKVEASNILSETNAKIENTIREIKEAQAEKERTRIIREEMPSYKIKMGLPINTTLSGSSKVGLKTLHPFHSHSYSAPSKPYDFAKSIIV